jgi:hypothetical protein
VLPRLRIACSSEVIGTPWITPNPGHQARLEAGPAADAESLGSLPVLGLAPTLEDDQSLRLIPRVGWAASRLLAFALFRLLRPQLISRQYKYARHFAYRTDNLELRKATEIPSTITAQLDGLALHDGVGIIKMHLFVWAGEAANDVVLGL